MSLTSALSVASQSLMAADGAIQVVNNNIANANTPGYTQENAILEESLGESVDGANVGGGVVFEGAQSVRDELLQNQMNQQTQSQTSANAQLTGLQQVEQVFTTSTNDIGTAMSNFFSSVSGLSSDPTSSSQRQAVLSAGNNLASAFNSASSQLSSQQLGLNTQVTQDVSQINQLAAQIAALNPQISTLNAQGKDADTLQDQQDELVSKLSGLAGVAITQTNNGITVTIGNSAVIAGDKSYALTASAGSNGLATVSDASGQNVTASILGGDLGGTLALQQTTLPQLQQQLDTLAYQMGSAVNQAQSSGFDQNGNAGTSFFHLPTSANGAAGNISVSLTTPEEVAASSDGTSGSNGNLASFAAVQNNALPSGATPGNTYAGMVFQVGQATASVQATSNAAQTNILQLTAQINSVSGVSIDQETTSLIQYQQAYQAAAQVVSTIQSLMNSTMTMMTAS